MPSLNVQGAALEEQEIVARYVFIFAKVFCTVAFKGNLVSITQIYDGISLIVFGQHRDNVVETGQLPESADIVVPWDDVESADLSLVSGKLTVRFTASYAQSANWLGGVRTLEGRWTDRLKIRRADVE